VVSFEGMGKRLMYLKWSERIEMIPDSSYVKDRDGPIALAVTFSCLDTVDCKKYTPGDLVRRKCVDRRLDQKLYCSLQI
jgi:hypothetical protein